MLLSDEAMARVAAGAATLAPGLADGGVVERWADLRPIAEDGLPLIGADPEMEGLYYATGYGRTGILLGPRAGAVVAGMIAGGPLPEGWEAFRPCRFG